MQSQLAPTMTIGNGVEYPTIGLGTWMSTDQEKLTKVIRAAFENGYRHIDTAILYNNHKLIGNSLKTIFEEGKYSRKDLFITTKQFPVREWNSVEKLKEALVDLGLDYVDLYLIHEPIDLQKKEKAVLHKPHHIIWKEFEECQKLGLTKSIGLSNFNVQAIMNILSFCEIRPANNQIEISPYNLQRDLVKFCQNEEISVTAYSSLAHGGQTHGRLNKLDIFSEPILKELSNKYNKSIAQVVLNYIHSFGLVVIPKTEKVERLKENFDWRDFTLDEEDKEKLATLDKGLRVIEPRMESNAFYPVPYFN